MPTVTPFTFQMYVGAVPPFTGTGFSVTVSPGHTLSVGAAAIVTVGGVSGLMITTALPDIFCVQPLVALVACIVYVPAVVSSPKLSAKPVPAKYPVAMLPLYNT